MDNMKKCFWCGETILDTATHKCDEKKARVKQQSVFFMVLFGLVAIGGLIAREPILIGLGLLLLFFLYVDFR